jgi:hypothetical protein
MRSIGRRTFSLEDQRLFAELSGDCNPMHVDPIAARRLMTGRQVVHGIHVMLSALEHRQEVDRGPPTSINCSFSSAVSVGDTVEFRQAEESQASILEASVDEVVCTRIILSFATATQPADDEPTPSGATRSRPVQLPGRLLEPMDEVPAFFLGKQFAVSLDGPDPSGPFAHSLRYLGREAVVAIVALSYIVGMACPGLHSVFSSLKLNLPKKAGAREPLRFTLCSHDPRFGLFEIGVSGPVDGLIRAFHRPPAMRQPSVLDLKPHVAEREFAGTRSLVIGGSRGLGEVTAKLLAAGGGDTVITYASGASDAQDVVEEISAGTPTRCEAVWLDLTTGRFDQCALDWNGFSAIYYFATPRIYKKKSGLFKVEHFNEFIEFYVSRFHDLCMFLETTLTGRKVRLYFPSTVFIDDRPKGLAEYAMAKSAAEVLIGEINRSFAKVTVCSSRLPRLSTDQTTSIMRLSTGSNAEILLPVIRSMQPARSTQA